VWHEQLGPAERPTPPPDMPPAARGATDGVVACPAGCVSGMRYVCEAGGHRRCYRCGGRGVIPAAAVSPEERARIVRVRIAGA
jgi:hypothetical protein